MPSWSERALDFPLLSLPRRGNQLGVVGNTPVIVKYPFWQMTLANAKAVYACLNYGEAFCPSEIAGRSIRIDGDIGDVFVSLPVPLL